MTRDQMLGMWREILPGAGNASDGEPRLKDGTWTIPFRRATFRLQVSLRDRPIASESDYQRAKEELESKIGLAIAQSDMS
jgi:hypothetical protein